jgi:SAM-dependent methyltransferase
LVDPGSKVREPGSDALVGACIRHPRSTEVNHSEEVRDFYERMPYPAPLTNLDDHRDLYRNQDRRRAFHLMWPARQPRANQEILVAGCGTSQAARYALREPDARITAIDVSDTSLRYTRDLQRKYNLENLELHQLPIESVREIGRSFDLVVCTECSITCPTRTSVFEPSATSCNRAARCA